LDGIITSSHDLKPIEQAYYEAKGVATIENPTFTTRKETLQTYYEKVNQKMESIDEETRLVQKHLSEQLEEVTKDLNKKVRTKVAILQTDKQELLRQY